MKLNRLKNTSASNAMPVLALLAFALFLFVPPSMGTTIEFVQNGSFENLVAGNSLGVAGGYFCKAGPTCVSNVQNWSSICHAGNACGGGGTPDALLYAGTGGSA